MDSSHVSPVLTDPVPINKSRLGIHSSFLSYSQQDPPLSLSPTKYSRSSSRKISGSLDDVRSNGWLDAMKASSPPRKKQSKGCHSQVASTDSDTEDDYCSWLVCLLFPYSFSFSVMTQINCRRIELFRLFVSAFHSFRFTVPA